MKIFKTIVVLLIANLQLLLANAGNAAYNLNGSTTANLPEPPMEALGGGSGGPGSQVPEGLPIDNFAVLLVVIAIGIIAYLVYSKKYKIV